MTSLDIPGHMNEETCLQNIGFQAFVWLTKLRWKCTFPQTVAVTVKNSSVTGFKSMAERALTGILVGTRRG